MKKIVLILFVILTNLILADSINVITSLDLPQDVEWRREIKDSLMDLMQKEKNYTLINFSIHSRYYFDLDERIDLGLGVGYEGELRYSDNYESIGYSTIPFYMASKYSFYKKDEKAIYISGNFGLSGILVNKKRVEDDYDKLKSGLYYGVGIGITRKGFLSEISYSVSNSSLESRDGDVVVQDSYSYPKISISFGKKIGL